MITIPALSHTVIPDNNFKDPGIQGRIKMDDTGIREEEAPRQGIRNSSLLTLIITPFIIAIIWQLENFLLAVNPHLFSKASFPGLVIFTVLSCVLMGIIVPVLRIQAAFLSGAVNTFQIGFRSVRRTTTAVSITALAGYTFFVFTGDVGGLDLAGGIILFIFFLPTAIAAVMICWVLIGTHIQAYVRQGGAIISICTGTLVTALIFAVSMSIFFIGPDFRQIFSGFFVAGLISALFFFAFRDVYATAIIVTSGLMILLNARIDPEYLNTFNPVIVFCGFLAIGVLAGTHWHFSRHYRTIVLPGK